MASSVNGQDELNPVILLATRESKITLSCPLEINRFVPQEKNVPARKHYRKSFTDQVRSLKMAGCWPLSFYACLWTWTSCLTDKDGNKGTLLNVWSIMFDN